MTNVTATGLPEAISRELYLQLIETLGIDPANVVKLEFRWNLIYVELKALDDDGNWIADSEKAAVHRIAIPVKEGLE